jgi:Tol biopolymer transport system component
VYTLLSPKREVGGIYVGSLDQADFRLRLAPEISSAEYAPLSSADPRTGYLLFARGDVLMAQRFDMSGLHLTGDAFQVLPKVSRSPISSRAGVSVSGGGILLTTRAFFGDQLTWFDRKGARLGTVGSPGLHFYPRISPDQRTLLADAVEGETFASYLWKYPLDTGAPARFMFTPSLRPIWSFDGSRVFFEGIDSALYVKSAAGAENETTVLEAGDIPNGMRLPCDQSRDEKFLIYSEAGPKTGFALWMLPLTGKRTPVPLLRGESNERCGAFSPSGNWMAYASDRSGRSEIYVQAFSGSGLTGAPQQVSYNGGSSPRWKKDGRELFFLAADMAIWAVDVSPGTSFHPGNPQRLFTPEIHSPDATFDVTDDGKRFILPASPSFSNSEFPSVVFNWISGSAHQARESQ